MIDLQLKLGQALDIIVRQERAITTTSNVSPRMDNETPREWIGYRLFWDHNCNYLHDLGFFSRANLRGGERVAKDEKGMFLSHVEGQYSPDSSYISVSDIPGRLWNLPASHRSDFEVAVIDLKRLQDLGYLVMRTTDLKQQFPVPGHVDYVTESHILVSPIIPHCCILGFLSKSELTRLCIDKKILPGGYNNKQPWAETNVIDLEQQLERSDFTLRSESRCGKPVYYQVPVAPPLVRRKFKLTKTKEQRSSSVIEPRTTNLEAQLHALYL